MFRKGYKPSKETRKKLSKAKKGKNHPNWKGGIKVLNLKEYYERYGKRYRLKNLEIIKQKGKEWREKNREKKRIMDRKYATTIRKKKRKLRRKVDPKFRLDSNMSTMISVCLKGKKAGQTWKNLVGYTIEQLMKHLENQFDDRMNWENYGSYWWIDHIEPRSLFDYTFPEDSGFKKCWALDNLQPLEKIANIRKGNKSPKVDIGKNLNKKTKYARRNN